MPQRVTWGGFLRRHKARPLVTAFFSGPYKGASPAASCNRLKNALVHKRITDEQFRMYMEIWEELSERYRKDRPVVAPRDLGDWRSVGDGGYHRKNHLGSDNR